MQKVIKGLLFGCFAIIFFSFFGSKTAFSDSLAVIRLPILIIAAIVIMLIQLRTIIRLPMLGICLLIYGASAQSTTQVTSIKLHHETTALRVYQKNLLVSANNINRVLEDGFAVNADIFTLQEVDKSARDTALKLLSDEWSILSCIGNQDFGLMIIARMHLNFLEAECETGKGYLLGSFQRNGKKIIIGALHLHWPYPYEQPEQVPEIINVLSGLQSDVIIGADLNMVPWGSVPSRIAEALSGDFYVPSETTFKNSKLLPIPIDYVFTPISAKVQIAKRPLLGSDHFGVVASVSF